MSVPVPVRGGGLEAVRDCLNLKKWRLSRFESVFTARRPTAARAARSLHSKFPEGVKLRLLPR